MNDIVKQPFKMDKKKALALLILILTLASMVLFVQSKHGQREPILQDKAQFVLMDLNKGFSPSTVATYENKTMHFQVANPYDGYAHWSYEHDGTVQGPSDNKYYMSTGTSGYAEYFGFDEFVDHRPVRSEAIFRTTLIAGTYHFQPLGYFYQKTALESKTHWALAIDWDASGIDLVYNTENGETPTSVNLVATVPTVGVDYRCLLSNLGLQTFVEIQDISTSPDYPIIFSGSVDTENYDARSLYAGFGQYSSGNGNIYGVWDNFTVIDSTFTYPQDGMGFDKIDVYVDEVFAQTLYDMDQKTNPALYVNVTASNITLFIDCWLNATTCGITTVAEGQDIIRHNLTITATGGTVVFSKENLTYITGADYGANVFLYQYSILLDFALVSGEIYSITITYDAFEPDTIPELVLATSGSGIESTTGTYADTQAVDGTFFTAYDLTYGFEAYLYLNFTAPSIGNLSSIDVNIYAKYNDLEFAPDINTIDVYDFGNTSWVTIGSLNEAVLAWVNDTVSPDFLDGDTLSLRCHLTYDEAIYIYVDYAEVGFYYGSWVRITSTTVYFGVPLDTTGLNMLITFLGLFMIPASTLYLVKGGRDGMSSNKVFYFIVAFMLGWGLLLSGIGLV